VPSGQYCVSREAIDEEQELCSPFSARECPEPVWSKACAHRPIPGIGTDLYCCTPLVCEVSRSRNMINERYPNQATTLALTKTGRPIYIRPLRPSDEPLIEELFKSLSPRSIFFRFLRYWKSVPPEVIAYFTKIDCELNVAMVAFEKREPEDLILGLCGILRKPGSVRGEFAVVVRDEWQGIGVGAELAAASLPAARDLGMKELWGIISPENTTMIAMASKLGFTVRKDRESDLYEMEMGL
jgi:acetyltransferase